ncbi:MAG: hypothetical protein MZV49_14325 [Rhodopseudomonas palustris]|nr:hypothetical protein [Rhodopseudomonas palustris]
MTLFASGSELMIAVAARPLLAERDISTRAGARPPFDLILAPPERDARRSSVRCRRGGVKGTVRFGCAAVIGPDGGFIGLCGRAEGAPALQSDRPFGVTAQPAAAAAMAPAAGCSPCG